MEKFGGSIWGESPKKEIKYIYEAQEKDIKRKCIWCGRKITDTEFEFEDYFVLFRGHSKNCFYGCICFKCYEAREAKEMGEVIK